MAEEKNAGQNIDQIRELIFGEQIRRYERQFKDNAKQIKQLSDSLTETHDKLMSELERRESKLIESLKELSDKMGKERKDLLRIVDDHEKQMQAKMQVLEADKTDRVQLANLLIDLGMRIKGENLLDTLDSAGDTSKHD